MSDPSTNDTNNGQRVQLTEQGVAYCAWRASYSGDWTDGLAAFRAGWDAGRRPRYEWDKDGATSCEECDQNSPCPTASAVGAALNPQETGR